MFIYCTKYLNSIRLDIKVIGYERERQRDRQRERDALLERQTEHTYPISMRLR